MTEATKKPKLNPLVASAIALVIVGIGIAAIYLYRDAKSDAALRATIIEYETKLEEHEALASEHQQLVRTHAELNDTAKVVQDQLAALKKDHDALVDAGWEQKYTDEAAAHQATLDELAQGSERLDAHIKSLTELNQEKEKLAADHHTLQVQYEESINAATELKAQLTALEKEHEALVAAEWEQKYTDEAGAHKATKEKLSVASDTIESQADALAQAAAAEKKQAAEQQTLQKSYADLLQSDNFLKAKFADLEKAHAALLDAGWQKKYTEEAAAHTATKKKLTQATESERAQSTALTKAADTRKNLESDQQAMQEKYAALQRSETALKTKLAKLEEKHAALVDAGWQKKYSDEVAAHAATKETLASATENVQSREDALTQANRVRKEQEAAAGEAEKERAAQEKTIRDLKTQLAEQTERMEAKDTRIKALETAAAPDSDAYQRKLDAYILKEKVFFQSGLAFISDDQRKITYMKAWLPKLTTPFTEQEVLKLVRVAQFRDEEVKVEAIVLLLNATPPPHSDSVTRRLVNSIVNTKLKAQLATTLENMQTTSQ